MEPSDIDGPNVPGEAIQLELVRARERIREFAGLNPGIDRDGPKGGETPGEMLARLLVQSSGWFAEPVAYNALVAVSEDVASAFKAAVLAGEV